MFFLATFLISIFTILLTWTKLAVNRVGIADIFNVIYRTAAENLADQGLSIFAFAFFLYAILQSQTFQSLFASKRKWLEKRKYFTVGLITVAVALLSSNLSWFDEFVHFYPLVIPLFLAMGFDIFSSILCLYGGSIAGLLGLVSSQRMNGHFAKSFGETGKSFNYTGLAGIGFRVLSFVLFVSLVILFNIWYCSRNRNKSTNKQTELSKAEIPPKFNRQRKIILAVAGFFLSVTILAQIPQVASALKIDKLSEKIPAEISSEYEEKKEGKYEEKGRIRKMEMAKVKENKQGYWEKFGNWKQRSLDCWLIIGAIIICLLARQSIIGTLTVATQNAVPLVLIYIFSSVPATIMAESDASKNLAKAILPATVTRSFKYKALFSIFGFSLLLNFFIASTALTAALVAVLAPALLAISESTLIYAAIFAWTGTILGMAFSPFNGILQASLKKGQTTYKQFIKKTWILGLIMTLTMFIFIALWTIFVVKG